MRFSKILICALIAFPPSIGGAQETPNKTAPKPAESAQAVGDKVPAKDAADKAQEEKPDAWKDLLPAEGLEGWEISDFGSEGEVKRDGKLLLLAKGEPLTGINYKLAFPKENYELEFSAQRISGNDFLCGLTFPVAEEYCSFIGGGWGGGIVGLSSVDGYDAAENATSLYHAFENERWYKFRLRVDSKNVTGWIDDKEVLQQERAGHKFSTRIEVYVSRPLGLCAFRSKVAIRDLKYRTLTDAEQTP